MDMTIDVNAVNFVEHAELLDVVLTKMQPGHIHGDIFLNLAHNFKPTSTLEVVLYLLEQKKRVEATSRTLKKKSCKKK